MTAKPTEQVLNVLCTKRCRQVAQKNLTDHKWTMKVARLRGNGAN